MCDDDAWLLTKVAIFCIFFQNWNASLKKGFGMVRKTALWNIQTAVNDSSAMGEGFPFKDIDLLSKSG